MHNNEDLLPTDTVPTGIPGLDAILGGGLPAHRVYVLEGDPGTGKTTQALQFLLDGVGRSERCLYVTLSETADELQAVSRSHGWTLDGIDTYELTPTGAEAAEQYTIFRPSEVELSNTIQAVMERVDTLNPTRVVIDSLAELRLLAAEPIRYRRQILALKQFFVGRRSTVLLLDDRSAQRTDLQVQSISHGVIRLEQRVAEYGQERRRLTVTKLRGVKYRGGYHDMRIETGGLRVFPRVVAADHATRPDVTTVSSEIPELDRLLGGGLSTGTSSIIIGPAGVGKTVLAAHYAAVMARTGHRAAIYLLDERLNTFVHRTGELGLGLPALIDEGRVVVRQLDPDAVMPGELAAQIRDQVERQDVRLILIDSLNGYLNAMRDEESVLVQLHELLSYLNHQNVVTLITVAQHGVLGMGMASPIDVSYLADTLVMLRFFEAEGAVHQAISVLKKRTGDHERTIREFQINQNGIRVGRPLTAFRGVLTGVPNYTGDAAPLLSDQRDGRH